MVIKTKPFNPFEFCETQAEIDAILIECYHDDDPNTFITALGYLTRHHGIAEVAKAAGLNRENLYKAFNGKVQPKWDTIHRVMKVLNIDFTIAA